MGFKVQLFSVLSQAPVPPDPGLMAVSPEELVLYCGESVDPLLCVPLSPQITGGSSTPRIQRFLTHLLPPKDRAPRRQACIVLTENNKKLMNVW